MTLSLEQMNHCSFGHQNGLYHSLGGPAWRFPCSSLITGLQKLAPSSSVCMKAASWQGSQSCPVYATSLLFAGGHQPALSIYQQVLTCHTLFPMVLGLSHLCLLPSPLGQSPCAIDILVCFGRDCKLRGCLPHRCMLAMVISKVTSFLLLLLGPPLSLSSQPQDHFISCCLFLPLPLSTSL